MPHPKYGAVRQIPPSPGKGEGQMPGECPGEGMGGGMCELRIDRYIKSMIPVSACAICFNERRDTKPNRDRPYTPCSCTQTEW